MAGRPTLVTGDLRPYSGEFTAVSTLAADFQTQVSAAEFETALVDFKNTLLVSAGCHSAYNTVDEDSIPLVTPGVDWAQAAARHNSNVEQLGYGSTSRSLPDTGVIAAGLRLTASPPRA